MAIYAVRYNLQCKAANHDEACITILDAASEEQAREFVAGTEPQECLGRECTEPPAHYPRMTVLSVREIKNFCMHGCLCQNRETEYYEFQYELSSDAQEEVESQFPGFVWASEYADRLSLPEDKREYVEEVSYGIQLDLDGLMG